MPMFDFDPETYLQASHIRWDLLDYYWELFDISKYKFTKGEQAAHDIYERIEGEQAYAEVKMGY